MSFRQPISDEQLAPFLEAAKLMTIPEDEVPPLVVDAIPEPYATQNETILTMHRALVAETIKTNANNTKEYEERKELWYHETAIAAYLDAKKKADEEEAKRKAEEAAAKKAAEEENEHVMDANSEGEDEVDKDETPKLKLKLKSRPIVDSESEETEEVKAKRRKAKGKGKAVDPEYSQNTFPVDYAGCPRIPVCKICEGCKVPANAWYQRPCVGDVLMDANDKIFYVGSKNRCFVCHMRSNICSFTRDKEAEFIMPEGADDEELQAKLRKLCDEQDAFKTQKDKEKVNVEASGSNVKASGSIPKGSKRKVVSEEDDIKVTSQPKRARMFTNPDGSVERIPPIAESLHGINKALIATVELLGDTQAANENQAKYLRGIKLSMVNLQSAMQTHVAQVHSHMVELERRVGIRPIEDEGFVDEEVEPAELEDLGEEVEEVHEEVEEVHEEDNEGCEVEDEETMKDPEADEL
ncbi:hypothetical protein M422DRAFT_260419 [Sphaerobolus stellatus SS14]|uniref:Uncharacterized protein n=1 Tax=Sphaerobolus stellatus (strain SS14) TaxID=990650 RepID=A0A0C9V630_SPHS4|nr:hypothetical protein M422DRAFT_260419 [Sphaerobolus stellatus SS14]